MVLTTGGFSSGFSGEYRLGDRGASIFYYTIGGGALAIGLIVLGR
ncbi:hypothetical protein [Limnofasciculus baicalensis]|nr:hypothetical protein [Limnofasciculus baicalensis]